MNEKEKKNLIDKINEISKTNEDITEYGDSFESAIGLIINVIKKF